MLSSILHAVSACRMFRILGPLHSYCWGCGKGLTGDGGLETADGAVVGVHSKGRMKTWYTSAGNLQKDVVSDAGVAVRGENVAMCGSGRLRKPHALEGRALCCRRFASRRAMFP